MMERLVAPLVVKQFFHRAADVMDLDADRSFLRALRLLLFPKGAPEVEGAIFPPFAPLEVPPLKGKKLGIVATGGGGAMVCAVGVARALEEAGLEVAGISTCSGSAMTLAPLAAGLDAEETARFLLSFEQRDYIHPDWKQLLKLPFALGKGFTGLLDSEPIEQLYAKRLGEVPVGELPIAFYANVWDLDHNRLFYLGSRTSPQMPLPHVVRAAVTLPLYMRPLEIDGAQCGDGGVVNIFPVDPLVDHHPEIDFYIGINAFYPENFRGEDHTGWDEQTFSLFRVSSQTKQCQHLEAARMQLRRIEDRCLMIHPLPYEEIRGIRLYEQFLDRTQWLGFIRRGHEAARRQLEALAS
ncbi:MAG: patatin-like phospholipase family protein [Myxococcales bacterium]|nr:patatin-like phospholipase family protein [Myxococcales bacterium]